MARKEVVMLEILKALALKYDALSAVAVCADLRKDNAEIANVLRQAIVQLEANP